MIKIGKPRINTKISSYVWIMAIIISLIMLIIFGTYTALNFIKTRNYIKIDAIVTNVSYYYEPSSDGESLINYIELKYTFDNLEYIGKQRVFFRNFQKVDKKVKIYVNPNNPKVIRDNYLTKLSIFIFIISLIFNIFTTKAYLTMKKEKLMEKDYEKRKNF